MHMPMYLLALHDFQPLFNSPIYSDCDCILGGKYVIKVVISLIAIFKKGNYILVAILA